MAVDVGKGKSYSVKTYANSGKSAKTYRPTTSSKSKSTSQPRTTKTYSNPVKASPVNASAKTNTVQSGQTLSSIARQLGTTVQAIMAANPSIKNPNVIQVGQQLVNPNYKAPTSPKAKAEPMMRSSIDGKMHPKSWWTSGQSVKVRDAMAAAKAKGTQVKASDKAKTTSKPVVSDKSKPAYTDKSKQGVPAPVRATDKTKGGLAKTALPTIPTVNDKTKGTASPIGNIVKGIGNLINKGPLTPSAPRNPTGGGSPGTPIGGGPIAPPIAPPTAPPGTPSTPPNIAPPTPPPTTVGGNPSTGIRSFTVHGTPGTFGALQRRRFGRGPRTGLSMTPEMVQRIAARRIGYQ